MTCLVQRADSRFIGTLGAFGTKGRLEDCQYNLSSCSQMLGGYLHGEAFPHGE